jgi:hypothetical protein
MVVHQSVPVAESTPRWRPGDWWSAAFRVLLLLVLVAGAATTMASMRPPQRPESDLTADLAAGRVTYLDYQPSNHEVRWANGWWRWRASTLVSWRETTERPSAVDPYNDTALQWLHQQVDASGHPTTVRIRADHQSEWWPANIVWEPLYAGAVVAWIGTFLLMLGHAHHRYANRWAWLWLFTIGQVGVLLYLILEPQPLWRPRRWPRPTNRTQARGGTGLIWAILLSIAVSLAAVGVVAI